MSKTRQCKKCKENKDASEFHKHKASKDGINTRCKVCVNISNNLYKSKNKKKIKEQGKIYRKENAKRIKERRKQNYEANKEVILKQQKRYRVAHKKEIAERNRKYREANAEAIATYKREYVKNNGDKIKEYREQNRDRIRAKHTEYTMRRYNEDVYFKMAHSLRSRLRLAIKRGQKAGSAVRDLGCSIEELKQHLEAQFTEGMGWENYGLDGWHIDHIIPLSSFDLTNREQFLKACHYTNLQPLWAKDNLHKGAKV